MSRANDDGGALAMRLFDDFERTDERPKLHGESDFEFLNRSARPPFARVRRELEEWFAAYPAPEQANLAGRFRDRRREQHLPAWWELYLSRLFTRLGWKVDVHPTLPTSSARVDFFVRHERGFFVEAVTAFSGIFDEDRNAAREAQVLDAIDKLRSQTFSISIDFDRVGTQTPPLRTIAADVETWLNQLNPDAVASGVARGAPYPSLVLEPEGWRIVIEAFPIAPEYRHEPPGG
jgi:hypothetical protein